MTPTTNLPFNNPAADLSGGKFLVPSSPRPSVAKVNCALAQMPLVEPDRNVDYKMIVQSPKPGVDYKLILVPSAGPRAMAR